MDAVEGWSEFNVAMLGAAAALAGLVIVAASVNIGDIVKAVSLTARLAAGISGLVLAIVASAIGLMPEISPPAYGVAILVVALASAVFPVQAARRIAQNHDPANRMPALKSLIGFVAPAAYAIGAVLLLAGLPGGLVLFAVGALLAIAAALLISWVVLVEVLR